MPKTLAYTLTIEFRPDEAGYLVFFPALPGCHSWGATCDEAISNAEEALIGNLEALQKNGESIPESSGKGPNSGDPLNVLEMAARASTCTAKSSFKSHQASLIREDSPCAMQIA